MPWWGWSSRPGAHPRPHVWLVLLSLHGCSGKGTHWQVLPMPYLQGQTAQGPTRKHCGHTLLRTCPPWLPVSGARKGLEVNDLVVTNCFTQYPQSYGTQSQTAMTTAKTLWDKFIVHYRLPKKILSDQDRNFESQLVAITAKFVQKMWHVKWAHKNAKSFKAKEAQCHKLNYDKRSLGG